MKIIVLLLALLCVNSAFAYDEAPTRQELQKWRTDADNGDPEAQFNVAEAYRKGDVVEQNEQEAAKWYERAANQGYPEAMFDMGFVYRGGNGVAMDKILSYMWFYLAVKNGDKRAMGLMNDLAWSMSEDEIKQGRRKANEWKPEKEEGIKKRNKRRLDE